MSAFDPKRTLVTRRARRRNCLAQELLLDENTFQTAGRARAMPMVSVGLVTTGFVIATFVVTKVRGYKKMRRALRDAITADAIFGALLLVRALL
jgi:sensor c-di-GMP phosphodiesterase-like protein